MKAFVHLLALTSRSAAASAVCLAAFVLGASQPAEAQNPFPSGCSPLGTATCSSMYPTTWTFSNRLTCTGYPARFSEEAARQDIVTDWTRPNQCNLSVTPNGGWLSGGPYSISYCGGSLNYNSLPYKHQGTGTPITNYRLYNVDHQENSPTCTSFHDGGIVSMNRSMVCPYLVSPQTNGSIVVDGVTYSATYCGVIGPLPPKNLGKCDGDCGNLTRHPINLTTGNKFRQENDYRASGAGGLAFERFYNRGGVPEAQVDGFGANFVAQVGRFWRHTYDRSISYVPTAAMTTAFAYRADGRVIAFNYYSGAYAPDKDIDAKLEALVGGGWKLTTENDDVELYDADGKLLSITTRAGIAQTLTYSDAATPASVAPVIGLLIGVSDSFGHALSFKYNASSQLTSMTDPAGGVFSYGYDTIGNLTSVTYPDTKVKTYVYGELTNTSNVSQPSTLTGIIDEDSSRYATFMYATNGRATYSGLAGGVDSTTVAYTTNADSTVTDALGKTRTFHFISTLGVPHITSLTSVCSDCGLPASQVFNDNGRATSKTDFNGNVTTYGYDLTRNLQTTRTEAYGTAKARTITTGWNATYRIPTSITEPNRTTTYTHYANGNVQTRTVTDTSVTPNVSRTWTYTYNAFGRVLTEDGPRTDVTDVTTYSYYTCTTGYQCGQLYTITNAKGHITTYNSYNAHGQPTQITDPNGLVTTLGYDSRQRLTDRCAGGTLPSCSGGELTHLDYWPTGLLKKVTNPDASYIQYTYDAAHRLYQVQDGDFNKIVYTLDNAGNRTGENTYDPSNALKRTHTRIFNTLNQLWKDVNAAGTANVTTVFGYDTNGNQITINAPLSRNSTNLYDELNRLKQITDPNSGITQFGYDANDNLTSVTDPRTLVTSYTYTGFGDLKTQTSPDTGLTTNTYDSGGNLATSTDSRSAITTYTYDNLNRVLTAAFKIGTTTDQTITYTYDTGTNGKGHLTGASDANHTLSWSYDAKGRVTGKGQTVGAITKSVGYGYNAFGQLGSIVLPSGKTIQYGYNTNGQVTSVTLLGSPNKTILSGITYDPFGPITGWTWGNGNASTRTFDTDGKLTNTGHSSTVVGNRTFGYDDAFRITSTTDTATSGPSWTLGYDLLDRLNSATKLGTTIGYTYDANGNRLTQTGTSASTYTVSGTSNRLSSATGALVRSYTYNNAGSVLQSGATTHTYYNSGRMATAKLGSAAVTTYIYNALGQRVKKSGGVAVTTLYVYDENGHILGEYDSSGTAVQETVWLGDVPIATLRGTSIFYVHTDQLNTPRKVTSNDPVPVLRWKWDPSPFGDGSGANENPTAAGPFSYNLRFPGQLFDGESNLNYNYSRDYDPATGRYDESDPIGLRAGINTYAYVNSSPVRAADPSGLFSLSANISYEYRDMFGGRTVPSISLSCRCEQKCGKWKLSGCSGKLNLRVLLGNTDDPDRAKWLRDSENQHVSDFLNDIDKYRRMGEAVEKEERFQNYSSKVECESTAMQLLTGFLRPLLQKTADETSARYDGLLGPHNRLLW